ncbi:unnamed protein product [Candidula unifasciata]|uniref:G-protein coupled receptors family 1 profile domain-containing protein n=1 Tax=Candidula unifasciata TaxID=100452 RepID=A0A8S4A7U4_9EUPU|nr:unnamed protein product [Candidula unifasciata]
MTSTTVAQQSKDASRDGDLDSSINFIQHGSNFVDADPLTDLIHWNLVFIVTPAVSIIGVLGNIVSLVVLAKQGFHKSSNILLFALAISDILFMVGVNGPPKPMYEWGAGGFQYPKLTAHVLYYLYHIFDSLNWGSGATSLCIPFLITVERLIAVFMPLKFKSIVTPRRTLISVIIPSVIFYGLQAYVRNWFEFAYVFDPARNASVGYAVRSDLFWRQRGALKILAVFVNCLTILIIFVFCGCIAIGVKIRMAALKRLKMTQKMTDQGGGKNNIRTSRTTKTLLFLCVFYTLTCCPICLPAFMPDVMVFPVYTEDPNFRSVGVFVYHVYKLMFSINASFNFVIYVATNKSFRDTLVALVRRQHPRVS